MVLLPGSLTAVQADLGAHLIHHLNQVLHLLIMMTHHQVEESSNLHHLLSTA